MLSSTNVEKTQKCWLELLPGRTLLTLGAPLRQRLYTVIEQTGPRWGGRIYIGRRLAVRVSGGAAYIRNVVELVGMVSAGVAIDHNPDGRRLMLILREHGLTPG
jgi:hypothetical protein